MALLRRCLFEVRARDELAEALTMNRGRSDAGGFRQQARQLMHREDGAACSPPISPAKATSSADTLLLTSSVPAGRHRCAYETHEQQRGGRGRVRMTSPLPGA